MKLNYAIGSDQGLVRGNNEDSAYAGPHLLILADGMGGHAAGEVASQLMVEHVSQLDIDPGSDDMRSMLATAADEANRSIARRIKKSPETDGMGTTLTTLLFNGTEFGLCHVGDSRGYRMRDGNLERITTDDTYVQSLVDRGELDPEDISTHPQRSMILKAYNGRVVEPTLKTLDARPGDRIMLCSDGLSDPVTDSTIETTLSSEGTPEGAVKQLIELALRSGGPDNVTVIVADVVADNDTDTPLPTGPLIAGAPNTGQELNPRPDTSSTRAAAVIAGSRAAKQAQKARQEAASLDDDTPTDPKIPEVPDPEDIEDLGDATGADTADIANGDDGVDDGYGTEEKPATKKKEKKKKTRKNRRGWIMGLVFIIIVAVLVTCFFFVDKYMKDRYFITVNANDKIVINQGMSSDILGGLWNTPYQEACLNANDNLTTIQVGAIESCHRFGLNDLKETARGSISSLPGGDYSEVLQQLHRLAAEALPACVIRKSETQTAAPPTPPAPSEAPRSDNNTPGEEPPTSTEPVPTPTTSQQVVDDGNLNTPGVTCREVN
ncbi:protein phosphatase 2C domain-containing protein [uncultured Corynebacterium sp.]|uniref:PP2C family protein-serine/threonine phosphatase n=1 Tax=uncultured Corynebacterium sp. TaxID=159447 RepID=UPI0028D05524|nr:protein phosphatase 2C domain-containing protein [uncultured Corynebacterium sp.]